MGQTGRAEGLRCRACSVSSAGRDPGRPDLRRHVRAGALVRSETARDHGLDPARQVRQAAISALCQRSAAAPWRARPKLRCRADRAVPRHARGRARRRRQHARRLSRATSPISPSHPGRDGGCIADARRPTTCAAICGALADARLCGRLGGAAAVGDPPALSLPLCRGPARRRSGRHHRGPEARPRRCRRC